MKRLVMIAMSILVVSLYAQTVVRRTQPTRGGRRVVRKVVERPVYRERYVARPYVSYGYGYPGYGYGFGYPYGGFYGGYGYGYPYGYYGYGPRVGFGFGFGI